MSLPTLGFGILLLLQAALAQSAPHMYTDIDDETLIDTLASLASAPSSRIASGDAFDSSNNKPKFADFDVPMEYLSSPMDIIKAGAGLGNLQRKFAYGPDDVRFFLPASQFPSSSDYQQQQQLEERMRIQQQRNNKADSLDLLDENDNEDGRNNRDSSHESFQQQQQHDLNQNIGQDTKNHQEIQQESNNLHYMKKSQPEMVEDGGGVNFRIPNSAGVVTGASQRSNSNSKTLSNNNESQSPYEMHHPQNPNYVMTSSHDVPNPVFRAENSNDSGISSFYYIAIIAACSAAIVVGVVAAGICWYRIHERVKAAAEVDYPAYGVTGPSKDVSPNGGDRKLAQSAHMYHYQHQKQQMAALQKTTMQGDRQGSGSDVESEDDNEDGDYTVYECPGLAGLCNSGEMEVKNPLYEDEPTPATPQVAPTEDRETASK